MGYILNYILLMLSTIMVVKAYERDEAQRTSGKNSKHHVLNIDHTRDRYSGHYNAEVGQKTRIETSHLTDVSKHHPVSGRIPATVYFNQHHSSANDRKNHPKLHVKHDHHSQYDTSSSHPDSHTLKHKDNNMQSGNHQYNHPNRQIQSAYGDNNPTEKYETPRGSRESDIKGYQKSPADRPREYDPTSFDDGKNLRYESPRGERQEDYNESKEKNATPFRYSHSVSDYPRERNQKESYQQNYQLHSPESSYKPSKGHNQMPHKKDTEVYSPEDPSNYHRYNSDKDRTLNSEYKTSYPEEPKTLSHYRGSSHADDYHHPSSHRDSNPSKPADHTNHYRESSHPEQFHSNADYRNSRLPKHSRSNYEYIHSNHPDNLQTDPNVKDSNLPEKSHSDYDYRDFSPSGVSNSKSGYRDSNLPKDLHNDRDQGERQKSDRYTHDHRDFPHGQTLRQPLRNEAKGSVNKPALLLKDGNPMRVVATRKDMQPAPSESDSSFSEEHDGFLDMGAYTDKQGSFGWYADFPVGKEHDKVTFSFS